MYPMAVIYSQRIYVTFTFQGPPKFSQIVILGLKIYHLATLSVGLLLIAATVNLLHSKKTRFHPWGEVLPLGPGVKLRMALRPDAIS
jgi:hypothetical protein